MTARAQEAVDLQMEAMGGNISSEQVNNVVDGKVLEGNISSEHVNSVVDVKGGTSGERRDCFNCGREDNFARDRKCPAQGRKCDQCGEIGHFKVKCRKKPSRDLQQGQRQSNSQRGCRDTSRVNERGRQSNTNYVDRTEPDT